MQSEQPFRLNETEVRAAFEANEPDGVELPTIGP